jgi:hypothetical protein
MANRRHSARRIKRLRSYNVLEAATATGASRQTVRRWHKDGLPAVAGHHPLIFRGADIIAYLKSRTAQRRQPCGPGRLYCLRCKAAKPPAEGMLEYRPETRSLGTLTALCPDCAGLMHRRASVRTLTAATGGLAVSMPRADVSLGETPPAHCNGYFKRDDAL